MEQLTDEQAGTTGPVLRLQAGMLASVSPDNSIELRHRLDVVSIVMCDCGAQYLWHTDHKTPRVNT